MIPSLAKSPLPLSEKKIRNWMTPSPPLVRKKSEIVSPPPSSPLVADKICERLLIPAVFVEQPLASPGSANNWLMKYDLHIHTSADENYDEYSEGMRINIVRG